MANCEERDRLKHEFELATVAFTAEDIKMQSAAFPIEELSEQEGRVENASRKLQEAAAALNQHMKSHSCAIDE